MNDPKPCQDRQESIAMLVMGELDASASAELTEHMNHCETCRRLYDALAEEETVIRSDFDALAQRMEATKSAAIERIDHQPSQHETRAVPYLARITRGVSAMTRFNKIAAAIIIVIGATVLTTVLVPDDSRTGAAFADVIQQVQKAWSVTYKRTMEMEGFPTHSSEHMLLNPAFSRITNSDGNVTINHYNEGFSLRIEPKDKKAIKVIRSAQRRRLGEHILNRIEWLSTLHDKEGQFMGTETIDGRVANVFTVEEERTKTTVWADSETDLPIRVERTVLPNPDPLESASMHLGTGDFDHSGHIRSKGGYAGDYDASVKTTFTYDDFVWNADLDMSLFSLDPPEGYALETQKVQSRTEQDLIQALQLWTELSEGAFPADIRELRACRPIIIKHFDKDGPPNEEYHQAWKAMRVLTSGGFFAQLLIDDGNWHYAGQGVTRGEADKAIAWYQPDGSETYRVIYGDLSVEDVSASDLPETP